MASLLTPVAAPESERPRRRKTPLPTWTRLTLVLFCLLELPVLGYTRVASGLGHLRPLQQMSVSDISAGSAAAACAEGLAAVDDFWPAVPLLNVGRIAPSGPARAWGQLPALVEVARQACPAVQVYATIAPSLDRSLDDGVGVDLLANVRHDRSRMIEANAHLTNAWSQLDGLDVAALSGDARLDRLGRLIATARAQRADVSDAFAILAPDTLETLLGGTRPRAIVLSVLGSDPAVGHAYVVVDAGRVVSLGMGEPVDAPVAIVAVDHAGLDGLRSVLPHAVIPEGASDALVAESLLAQVTRLSLLDNENVASALKHSAEEGHAWIWFDDPALQQLVARRGWVRQ